MAISDLKGTILAINEKLAQIFGKSKDELIGTSGYDNVETEAGKQRRKIIEKVIKTKKSIELIDQERGCWWKAIFHPILDDKGTVVKLAYYIKDVTREKEAEQNLEKREIELQDISQKFQIITDNMTDFVFQITLTGKFTYVNPVSERYGYKPEEMIGRNFTKFVPKKELPRYFTQIKKMISGEKIDCFESFVIYKSGHLIPTEFSGQMVKVGKKRYINGIMRNISERKKHELILKESEEKFRMLSDQSLMGLGIIQGEQIKYTNNAITQITGYTKDDMFREGTKILAKIIPPEYLSFVQEQLQKKLAGNKDVISRYSCKIITKTGVIKWVEIFSKTIRYEGENADFITFVDITDAKKAEGLVRKSEEKWRSLVENAPDIITQVDSKGIVRYVSHLPKDKKLKNLNPVGKSVLDFLPKEYHNTVENTYNRVLKTGISESFVFQGLISGRWFSTHVGAIFDNETPIGLTTITRDITDQKKADYNIRRGKDYLQNIIDSTSEIIFTIGNDSKIKTWNKTAEQITGHKKRQVIGRSIKQLDIFYNSSEIEEYIKIVQNKKTAILDEISIKTLYGMTRTFSISPSYIKDESNNIIETLFVCRDITKEIETYGKIQSGYSYLIQESDNIAAIDLFNSLLESKKLGLYIGRISNKELQTSFKKINPKIIKLTAQKDDRYSTSTNIEELYQKIKDFIKNKKNTVLLIDRLDYLIAKSSFESIMKNLYKINDLIQKQDSILLLRVNPSIINQNQIATLNEEFKKLPSQKIIDIQISQELYEILTYIQNEGKNNIAVTYGTIGKTFSISKVTVKKRLESLKDSGLIYSRKQGKTKILNITEKGKNLFKHTSTI